MPNQVRVGFGITGVSKAESDLDRLKNKVTGIKNAGAGGVLKGVGLGVGIGLFNQATLAVGGLGGALVDATQAAIEDEASQQRLRTTLEAAIPAWDGNTDAIEAVLAARIKLGFSDDEQRESLATLVTATGSVTTSLDLQRGAMDLARKAGVSLETASDAVAKAFGGQDKQLKTLLPGLQRGATNMDTLANAFDAARGQADAYAETTGGKVLTAQTKMNEAMEKLGYTLLPAVAEGADLVATAVDGLSTGIDLAAAGNDGLNVSLNASIPIYGQLLQLADALAAANRETARTAVNARNAMHLVSNPTGSTSGGGGGGTIKKRASGGSASGRTLVGEEGPELVDLPSGSFVHSNRESQQMAGGSNHTINIYGADVSNPKRIRDVLDRGVFMATGKPWDPGGPWASTR